MITVRNGARLKWERAEAWEAEAECYTGFPARWTVQFWDTHQESRHGKRRMAWAIFEAGRMVAHGRDFWPSPMHACDGEHAARDCLAFYWDAGGLEEPPEVTLSPA